MARSRRGAAVRLQRAGLLWVALSSGGLSALGLGGAAQAQDLQAFRDLSAALDAAQSGRQESAATALRHLDAADAAYARLAPTLQDDQLRSALEITLQRSKAALSSSPQALVVQASYAQALMRRALYDQTLNDLAQAQGNGLEVSADIRARLEGLGAAFGLGASEQAALLADAEAGHLTLVASRLQAQAARKVVAYLEPVAQGTLPANSPRGYVRVGDASGWHLVLQGTRGVPDQAADFRAVLELLAQGRGEQARPKLAELLISAKVAQQALEGAEAAGVQAAQPPPEPATPQAEAQAQAQPPPNAASPSVVVETGVPEAGEAQEAVMDALPVLQTVDSEGNEVALPAVEQALGNVYAAMGRALADTLVHDSEGARAELRLAAAGLAIADLPINADEARQEQRRRLLALAEQPSLGTGDVGLQLVALRELEHPDSVRVGWLASIWSSSLQLAAFLSLALVAPVPLRLALRAVGRQNREWNMVVVGIGFLLLPLVLEGVAVLGLWLGDISGIEALNNLGWLGIRRSPVGQIAWWLFSLVGIMLISLGFRGLSATSGRVAAVRRDWQASRHTEVGTVVSGDMLNPSATATGASGGRVRRSAMAVRAAEQRPARDTEHTALLRSTSASSGQVSRIIRPKLSGQSQAESELAAEAETAHARARQPNARRRTSDITSPPPPMQSTAERQASLERLAGRLGNDRLRRIIARQTQDSNTRK